MPNDQRYSRDYVARFYDEYGELEWRRFERSPAEAVKLFIHEHYLRTYIARGARVLEIGAGPGRFTHVLHELGCRVVVVDVSPVQLDLNKRNAATMGFGAAVEQWLLADICDLSALASRAFDAVLVYGGPLSYVFGQAELVLTECHRVLRSKGILLASVMSLWGTLHQHLQATLGISIANNRRIVRSGDLTPETDPTSRHYCHMFRSDELTALLMRARFDVLQLSASNVLTGVHGDWLSAAQADAQRWSSLLDAELEAAAQPGCVDMGTHLIAAARKRNAIEQPALKRPSAARGPTKFQR